MLEAKQLASILAGALADRFGRRFTLILGLVCAATARIALGLANTFFIALIVFSKLPETQPDKGSGSSGENFAQTLAGYKRTLQDGIFVAFVLISILTVTVYMQMSTTLSVYLVKFQHMSGSFFGTLVMLNALMVVFLQFSISRWASRQPLLIIMIAGTAFYLVGFGSYGLPPSIPLFIFAMILITLGEMLVIPTSQALTALLAHSGYARPLCGNGAPQLDHCSIVGSTCRGGSYGSL